MYEPIVQGFIKGIEIIRPAFDWLTGLEVCFIAAGYLATKELRAYRKLTS